MGLVVAHIAVHQFGPSGVHTVTTPPIDTTGATSIYLAGAGVFGVGVPAGGLDNQGNSYDLIGNPFGANSRGMGFWHIHNPVTSTSHTFSVNNDQNDICEICVLAIRPVIPTGTATFSQEALGSLKNPVQATDGPNLVPIVPTAPQWVFVTAGLPGAGGWTGGIPTIDQGFTITDFEPAGLAMAYLVASDTSGINPTWSTLAGSSTAFGTNAGAIGLEASTLFTPNGGNWFVYEA